MYQGETITTTISGFPVPVSEIANLYIIFRSSAKILIEKTFADCTVDGETVSFKLSQRESLNLCCGPITRSVIVITKDAFMLKTNFGRKPPLYTARLKLHDGKGIDQ